jgi:hypothetical protein
MRRRALLKLLALLPWLGPTMAKALTKIESKPVRRHGPFLPGSFPKWNRTVDGLEDAGAWCFDFQRAWLPKELVVPRAGEIWEAVQNCEVNFRVRHTELYSPKLFKAVAGMATATAHILLFGGKAQLRHGERIQIVGVDDPQKPLFVTFVPVRYEELQETIVPEESGRRPHLAVMNFQHEQREQSPIFPGKIRRRILWMLLNWSGTQMYSPDQTSACVALLPRMRDAALHIFRNRCQCDIVICVEPL